MAIDDEVQLLAFARSMLAEVAPEIPVQELELGTSLWTLGVESVVAAELVARVEAETGTLLPEDELIEVDTIGGLASVLRTHGGLPGS